MRPHLPWLTLTSTTIVIPMPASTAIRGGATRPDSGRGWARGARGLCFPVARQSLVPIQRAQTGLHDYVSPLRTKNVRFCTFSWLSTG